MDKPAVARSADAVQTALAVWPDLAEASRVAEQLNRLYPIIVVGVRDLDGRADSRVLAPAWRSSRATTEGTPVVRAINTDCSE